MDAERFDYQAQQEQDRRRQEEQQEWLRKWRKEWDEWEKHGLTKEHANAA